MKLVIHAPNVHHGGGRTLLLDLLGALREGDRCSLILDERFEGTPQLPSGSTVVRVAPSIASRLAAELRLRGLVSASDRVLCFGNLPPLFRLEGKVFVYLQNRYLVGPAETAGLPARARLRIALERLWLRTRLGNADVVIVQTPSMQRDVLRWLERDSLVMPFANCAVAREAPAHAPGSPPGRFLYVATGAPHKNHERLIEAWSLLAGDGIFPELILTLPPPLPPSLSLAMERAVQGGGARIRNAGTLSAEALRQAYRDADALIFPSVMESFGLPLLEARAAGLPVLASERDYVRDLITPEEAFDPESALSIARAVRRFMKRPDAPIAVSGAETFVDWLRSPLHRRCACNADPYGTAGITSSVTIRESHPGPVRGSSSTVPPTGGVTRDDENRG